VTPTTTIEVLADRSRRDILDALRDGEQSVNALVTRLGVSQPSVSKHLKVLRDAGLVDVRPDGQRRLYRLRPEPLMELDTWLEPYRQLWRTSLDKLERHLTDSQFSDPSTTARNPA
jgi:DNA-binding transcriptional ArsR family regulator